MQQSHCELIIGVNASPMITSEYKKTIMGVAMRSYHFIYKSNIIFDKELCDFLIEPAGIENYEMFGTDKSREIFELGYSSAKDLIIERTKKNKR